ncbi:PAP fimbrial minor pilin protein precursor [Serratia quinivorans]|uniref:fimbrial protein n=1 Tax=Serratia TaxID=613 RepID=UPI00217A0A35|nr:MULTISPECIES: fimbrial protein [Serratia]CAI0837296.1 PAP fimbrial minor pilin protein precursor [Serratia quinivorans]CAI1033687.1 PAP fimbrial minor pilin protein precursor [Serratia quinivorans]CAI1033743.1 PAP fimbrial minor pilin protein precursor [Serratia quinivorans]CAI1048944.1 PAP fimbrial minor pilin protein precursor [Serratia quinivorans]CAI1124066.1 PAP fimbrial minor pilin protein precursor [Serratia entomophila]
MHINRKTLIVFSSLLPQLFFSVQAAGGLAGWGVVNMQGSIIDTACAIAVDSREQSIDMGIIPVADIIRDGQGRSKPFSIDLINCVLERPGKEAWKNFQVTFDGDTEGALFGVHGGASGVGLQISDGLGNIAFPGKALPLMDIVPGDRQLNYSLKLVANNHALKSGDYFSSIRFKLDYF